MTNGSSIFLGGWEAALAVCEGNNPLHITCLVETCDGPSEMQNRNGRFHRMSPPGGVRHMKIPATRMAQNMLAQRVRQAYEPLFAALAVPGTMMLVHCKNGRHRSAQVCSALLFGIMGGSAEYVLNYLIFRRAAVQFHALPGPRPRASQ